MKRCILIFIMVCALILPGCRNTASSASQPSSASTESTQPESTLPATAPDEAVTDAVAQKPMVSVFVPIITERDYAEDGTEIFVYAHQSMSLVTQESDVAEKIILDFLNRVDKLAENVDAMQAASRQAYTPSDNWFPYMNKTIFEPTRIDKGVLSLFGTNSTYQGGVHPDHLAVSASYDLLTGDVLTLGSIMHKDATSQMFCDLVLEQLKDMEDTHYLFSDYASAVQKRFQIDESMDESFYFSQTGLCFYFSPYEIAPYSSGTIVVEIPYEKLTGLMHDSYFPDESSLSRGTISCGVFQNTDLEKLSQIGEAIITPAGEMHMLTTDGALGNIRIRFSRDNPMEDSYTFFAASSLSPGDGILLQVLPEQLEQIQITYDNADGPQFFNISE